MKQRTQVAVALLTAGLCLAALSELAAAQEKAKMAKPGSTKSAPAVHVDLTPVDVHVLSNANSVQQCYKHVHRCIVPVYVHTAWPDQTSNCSAWIDPANIFVPQPDNTNGTTRIKIIFVLKKGDATTDLTQFTFDSNYGVKPAAGAPSDEFTSEGFDTADGNNSDPDDSTSTGATHRRYRWASTHKVHQNANGSYAGVGFTLTVLRVTGTGLNLQVQTCDAGDPTITNTN